MSSSFVVFVCPAAPLQAGCAAAVCGAAQRARSAGVCLQCAARCRWSRSPAGGRGSEGNPVPVQVSRGHFYLLQVRLLFHRSLILQQCLLHCHSCGVSSMRSCFSNVLKLFLYQPSQYSWSLCLQKTTMCHCGIAIDMRHTHILASERLTNGCSCFHVNSKKVCGRRCGRRCSNSAITTEHCQR